MSTAIVEKLGPYLFRTASGSHYQLEGDPEPEFVAFCDRIGKPLDRADPVRFKERAAAPAARPAMLHGSGRSLMHSLLALPLLAMGAGGGARLDPEPVLREEDCPPAPSIRPQVRAQASATNQREAARLDRQGAADPEKKRRRKAARKARKKNR